jgi:membrane associated rhomboid family serine protease
MIKNILKYTSIQFRMRENGLMKVLLGNLIVISILMIGRFILRLLGYDDIYEIVEKSLSMSSSWSSLVDKPWSMITYLFVQKGFLSIIWSMLLLYSFGRMILNFLGSKHFVLLYFFGGIVGALMVLFIYNIFPRFRGVHTTIYGIDSCVYAVIAALSTLSPNYPLRLFIFGNVKLKHILFVLLFTALSRLDEGSALGICQLGGALGGYLYIKIMSSKTGGLLMKFKRVFKGRSKIVVINR